MTWSFAFRTIIQWGLYAALLSLPTLLFAQVIGTSTATTTLTVGICGDTIITTPEECDVPGEVGAYSTSILGRQCNVLCKFGPYCGDTILQTTFAEECDDGNNVSGDFCTADCKAEPIGGGGGSSSGSGGGARGGSDTELGDTQVSIQGKAYPNANVNILQDGDVIGVVRANSAADFFFNTESDPGTTSFGFWATDSSGLRSISFNTTFDVIQGAVTNITGIFLPPTLGIDNKIIDRGDIIILSGQSVPEVDIVTEIHSDANITENTETDEDGDWELVFDTARVDENVHTAQARFEFFIGGNKSQSSLSQAVTFFVGVSPDAIISSSDLNQDGFVNLIDFSILIFWWGTGGGNSNPPADINNNGNVGLEDFSILLFNWTG